MYRVYSAIFIASSLLIGYSTQPTIHDIPNFGIVDKTRAIYRGGQPLNAEAWEYLWTECGVSNVIKFNLEEEASDASAELLDFQVYGFPINAWQQIFGFGLNERFVRASFYVTPGTYIHCSHGKNRTGTFVKYLRRTQYGWTKEECNKEANIYGWQDSLPGLRIFWWNVK